MERLTKLTVGLAVAVAIATQVMLLRVSWPQLPWLALAAAVILALLSAFDRRVVALVMASSYVFSVIVHWLHDWQYNPYVALWMAALFGVMLPDILRRPWQIPRRWRLPLVYAALAVIVSATIVIWRECDGTWGLFWNFDAMYFRGNTPPPFLVTWTLHVALILGIGVLWFDWLCGAADLDFETVVITPLVAAAMTSAAVSAYQMFVRISFFNQTVFATIGRATGTMWDANVAGMMSAIWIGGTALWAIRGRGWRVPVALVGVVLHGLAVWGSGSRTALACAALAGAAVIGTLLLTAGRYRLLRGTLGAAVVAAVVAGVAAAGITVATNDPRAGNPAARLWDTFTSFPSPQALAREMWNRNGYGTSSTTFIRRFPVAGIGVGAFHTLVTGSVPGVWLPPDNAQNWLRHQVAELGFLGGAGWIVWFLVFAWFVLVPRRGEPRGLWIPRVALAAFGFSSQFGMPGQDLMVTMTFWTLAFWYARLAGLPPGPSRGLPKWTWGLVAAGLAAFAVSASLTASSDLRLPQRALRDNIPFSYGIGPARGEGPDAGFRSLQPRAVTLADHSSRWLVVTVKLSEGAPPAAIVVTGDGHTLVKAQLAGSTLVVGVIEIPDGSPRIRLEAVVDRGGLPWQVDPAGTGVMIKWESVFDRPPQIQPYPR